jgi:hypothetical protein
VPLPFSPRHPNAKRRKTPAGLGRLRQEEAGRLLIKGHTQLMRLIKSWLMARVGWVLAMIILLWVGTFLTLLATGLEVPSALTTADSPHVNQETNGGWHPLGPIYLAVSAEEAKEVDEHPVNAELLSVLLLALSLWASVVWLLTNGRGHRVFRSLGIARPLLSALEDRSFLGVFRL